MWRFRRRSRDRRTRSRDRKTSRDRRSRSRKRSPTPPPTVRPPFRRATRSPLGLRGQSPIEELSSEERDARTVFCMQLSQRIRARDLEEFFSSVGKVRDVRMIVCNKTRRFKGIAYIEFKDPESVALVSIFYISADRWVTKWGFPGFGFVRSKVAGRADCCAAHASREEPDGKRDAQHAAERNDGTDEALCRFVTL